MAEFKDISLKCQQCEGDFIFTPGEQEFFKEKGFDNQPMRCLECRRTRKKERRAARRTAGRNKPKGPKPCYAFRDGTCEFGDECRFSHSAESQEPRAKQSCFKFAEGACDYGDKCRFTHDAAE